MGRLSLGGLPRNSYTLLYEPFHVTTCWFNVKVASRPRNTFVFLPHGGYNPSTSLFVNRKIQASNNHMWLYSLVRYVPDQIF